MDFVVGLSIIVTHIFEYSKKIIFKQLTFICFDKDLNVVEMIVKNDGRDCARALRAYAIACLL